MCEPGTVRVEVHDLRIENAGAWPEAWQLIGAVSVNGGKRRDRVLREYDDHGPRRSSRTPIQRADSARAYLEAHQPGARWWILDAGLEEERDRHRAAARPFCEEVA